jgi:hypothetical protein
MSTLLCIGLGYSASVVARRFRAQGWVTIGSSTTEAGLDRIRAAGHEAVTFDGVTASDGLRAAIGRASHLLVSVPPREGVVGDPLLALHGEDLVNAPHLAWIGYLSTIGVYGDRQGGIVDETSAPRPSEPRSVRRLAAERAWQALGNVRTTPVAVLRLAGIYGPGRSQLDAVRAGTARRILAPGQIFNRIHVDDIASVVEACIARMVDGVVNVTDHEPTSGESVVAYAARLLGAPLPPAVPLDEAGLSPMGRSFYAECKRVVSRRIEPELGVRLAYPSYREGLAAILASEGDGRRTRDEKQA